LTQALLLPQGLYLKSDVGIEQIGRILRASLFVLEFLG
jgi:hypothetical protein